MSAHHRAWLSSVARFVGRAKSIDGEALAGRAIVVLRHVALVAGRTHVEDSDVLTVTAWLIGHLPRATRELVGILRERGGRAIDLPEIEERAGFTRPALARCSRQLEAVGLTKVYVVRRGCLSVTAIALTEQGHDLICDRGAELRLPAPRNEFEREGSDPDGLVL